LSITVLNNEQIYWSFGPATVAGAGAAALAAVDRLECSFISQCMLDLDPRGSVLLQSLHVCKAIRALPRLAGAVSL